VSAVEDEDAAFEERVRRSRQDARRGWFLALVLFFGLPALAPLILLSAYADRLGTQASLALLLVACTGAVAMVEVARRVWRRPPT
jgi:hypothetical protein